MREAGVDIENKAREIAAMMARVKEVPKEEMETFIKQNFGRTTSDSIMRNWENGKIGRTLLIKGICSKIPVPGLDMALSEMVEGHVDELDAENRKKSVDIAKEIIMSN